MLIGTADAAKRLGISRQAVHQLLVRGTLAGRKISAKAWAIEESSVKEYALRKEKPAVEAG